MKRLFLVFCFLILAAGGGKSKLPPVEVQLQNFVAARSPTLWLDSSDTTTLVRSPDNTGLVTHFHCEDNAANTTVTNSGSGADGTSANNTADMNTSGALCKIDDCFTFAIATSDDIDVGSDVIDTGAYSFCTWAYRTVAAGTDRFFDNGKASCFLDAGNAKINCTSDGYGTTVSSANNSFLDEVHYHVCITRDASANLNIYIDSELSGDADQDAGTPASGTGNVIIGNRADGSRDWDGTMDDIRIYNRVLDAEEIKSLYNQGTGTHGSSTIARWSSKFGSVTFPEGVSIYQPFYTKNINGRHSLEFEVDNASSMYSATTIDDVMNANAKTIIGVYKPESLVGLNQYLLTVASNRFLIYLNEANFRVNNHDGGNDTTATGLTATVGKPFIFYATHDGTTLTAGVNSLTPKTVASGNTSTMTSGLYLCSDSARANSCDGEFPELMTFDKVLPASDIDTIKKLLAKKWGVSLN